VDPRLRVDVGIVTWNTRDLTVKAIRRLVDGEPTCDLRILVHDNASNDGTPEAIRAEVPQAMVEVAGANLGFARGMNRLIARSDAPWFLALNSDAWPDPGAVATMVRAAQEHPNIGAVAPRIERPEGGLEHSTFPFPSARVALLTMARGYSQRFGRTARRRLLVGAWDHDKPTTVDWAVGAALLMPRAVIDRVGGFDERFFMYAEDLDWCWRATRAGHPVWFEPKAVIRHVGGASAAQSYGDRAPIAYMRNTYRFYRRAHGAIATAAYRAANLIGSSRLLASHLIRRDHRQARYWAIQVRANLTSSRGADGPPPR